MGRADWRPDFEKNWTQLSSGKGGCGRVLVSVQSFGKGSFGTVFGYCTFVTVWRVKVFPKDGTVHWRGRS